MYRPHPIDTSHIKLPPELEELTESLAENTHDLWAQQRLSQGWTYGPERDDTLKKHPGLVNYNELTETEKAYDRTTAMEALKLVVALGYRIQRPGSGTLSISEAEIPWVMRRLLGSDSLALGTLNVVWRGLARKREVGSPELYCLLGERILKVGEPLMAHDVLTEGLEYWPGNVRLRQLLALALARSGATYRANHMLMQLREEGQTEPQLAEETLSILARTHKDLWLHAKTPEEGVTQLRLAQELYAAAYRLTGGYYPGINAATTALLRGEDDTAQQLAREVQAVALAEVRRLTPLGGDLYWPQATLGEAALLLQNWDEAENWYAQAVQTGHGRLADLSATHRQAQLIFKYLDYDPRRFDHCFHVTNVAVFASHLPAPTGQSTPKASAARERLLQREILARVEELQAGIGYAVPACEADIIFLEIMLERGIEINVVLPFPEDEFRRVQADLLHDPKWSRRFNKVLENAAQVYTVNEHGSSEHTMTWRYAYLFMDGIATLRAQTLHTSVVPLMVWDSTPRPSNGVADFLLRHWIRRDRSVALVEMGTKQPKTLPRLVPAPKIVPPNLAETQDIDPSQQIRTLLFADTAGYSRLTDAQLPLFRKHVLDPIADLVADFAAKTPGEVLEKNTWGDALYFVFANIAAAGHFALDLRDVLRRMPWASIGLPESLGLRIALHCGPVYTRFEPITGRINHCGAHVNLASRIEPITPVGHVYASQAFAALAQAEGLTHIKCDYVGQVSLAKGYGTFPMYHVHRWDDPE